MLWMYLKGKNPVVAWASESALLKSFTHNSHNFFASLSLLETIIISYCQFTFRLGLVSADLNPLNNFTKVIQDYSTADWGFDTTNAVCKSSCAL